MSNARYLKLWKEAEEDLEKVLEDDKAVVSEDVIEDREGAKRRVSKNYIRYILCINKLNECQDLIIHPDKRKTLKTLLEAALGRLLEVKQELAGMLLSDYSYLDDILLEMKLTRFDIDIQVPRYYQRERSEEMSQMFQNIDRILEEYSMPKEDDQEPGEDEDKANKLEEQIEEEKDVKKRTKFKRPEPVKKEEISEEQKEFIRIISMLQRHERARVGRLVVQGILERQGIKSALASGAYVPPPVSQVVKSAKVIQRFWTGYHERHKKWCRELKVREMIGEVRPSWRSREEEDGAEIIKEQRRDEQKVAVVESEKANDLIVMAVNRKDEEIMEDIGDEMRWYIENWFRVVGELPEFPEPEKILCPDRLLGVPKGVPKEFSDRHFTLVPASYPGLPPLYLGGSALIVAGFWISPELYSLAYETAKRSGGQKKPKLTKEQIKEQKEAEKEKKQAEKEAKQQELEEKLKMGFVPKETKLLVKIGFNLETSRKIWGNQDGASELQQGRDAIIEDLSMEQQLRLREAVDELMRLELEKLQAALDRDRKKKKKGKGKKKKPKKGPKAPKDQTKDRTTESLFQELVEQGIIKKYPFTKVEAFLGDFSWNNHELQKDPFYQDPLPGLGDVRQVVKEYCILPLGSQVVHQTAPLIRSVLLSGAAECGHQLLVNAVCTEAGAVLFDVSPSNIVGKYTGGKGKKMLVHLVSKMSRLLQPSVVFVGEAEKMFYKKVPKPERAMNPKFLKTSLPKMVKEVKPEDQILYLGTCEMPWLSTGKALAKAYNKIILIPRPDHGSSSKYWFEKLMTYHGVDRDFLYTSLVDSCRGFSFPAIDRIIGRVMTPRRIIALKYRPLHPTEFLKESFEESPVTDEIQQKMVTWYNKFYPLAKKRTEKLTEEAEARQKLAAAEEKRNQRKKK